MNRNTRWLVFDVESIGLHGEAWAVGWVVGRVEEEEVPPRRNQFITSNEGLIYCDPEMAKGHDDDLQWVLENCHHKDYPSFGGSKVERPLDVRTIFWNIWLELGGRNAEIVMAADCTWPVEANFLSACVRDDDIDRRWKGPYPLIDITTWRYAAGHDAMKRAWRTTNELPEHNPLTDARQSARLLAESMG